MEWQEIKCKGCNKQEGKMFMMLPAKSADDVWCEECRIKEIEQRAKG